MSAEYLTSSLEWLNLSLDAINPDSPLMREKIKLAKPQIKSDNQNFGVNPQDIIELIDEIFPTISKNLSGEERDDLGLIIDATELLSEDRWISALKKLIINKSLREQMGKNAREKALKNYSLNIVSESYAKVLNLRLKD